MSCFMSYSKLLKAGCTGDHIRDYFRESTRDINADTRSLDYSSP